MGSELKLLGLFSKTGSETGSGSLLRRLSTWTCDGPRVSGWRSGSPRTRGPGCQAGQRQGRNALAKLIPADTWAKAAKLVRDRSMVDLWRYTTSKQQTLGRVKRSATGLSAGLRALPEPETRSWVRV